MWIEKTMLSVLLMAVQCLADSENVSKGDFLQATMYKIQRERLGMIEEESTHKPEVHSTTYQAQQDEYEASPPDGIEQLALAKDQLLAIYNAAVNKASKLKFGDLPPFHSNQDDDSTLIQSTEQGQIPGYYYYFYPIKSFMTDMIKEPDTSETMNTKNNNKDMMHEDIPKTIEPLFAAMASFVGVAMMFVMTILFLPKFGILKSRGIVFKEGSEELIAFTRILSDSVQGKDCSQKIACHVGKTLRNMHMGTNTIKIFELMLPNNLGKQLARIRRSAAKKEKCHHLKCKSVPKEQQPEEDS